jgi:hypothetical protein
MNFTRFPLMISGLVALISFVSLAPPADAELPPDVYEEMKRRSPERISLTITSVKITKKPRPKGMQRLISAEARVTAVDTSGSGLRPGDKIRLQYINEKWAEPVVGPSEPEIVKKGRTYTAYLAHDRASASYKPAAGGHSFEAPGQP